MKRTGRRSEHNPRGLTDRQVQVMDLMRAHGCWKKVGEVTNTSRHNVQMLMADVAEQLGVKTPMLALLEWDRMKNKRDELKQRAMNSVFDWRF
jgi:transcriptional regulator